MIQAASRTVMKKVIRASLLIAALFGAAVAHGAQSVHGAQTQAQTPKRPKLLGIAHVAFATDDMANSRAFFSDYLGYAEENEIKRPGEESGDSVVYMTVYKVNDEQVIQLFPERPDRKNRDNKLMHVAFLTDNAEALRIYLASKGCAVPAQVNRGKDIDNLNFVVHDPNGVAIEIVQYPVGGFTSTTRGQFLSSRRLSTRISHVGFSCDDVDKALDFYVNVLGFREVWRGGPTPDKVAWIHLKFPDSDQTIELMLSDEAQQTKAKLGSQNHICLEVKDIKTVESELAKRTLPPGCVVKTPAIGQDHKWQLNVLNYDGTRVEYMEDHTWDGVKPPSSTGKPMRKAAATHAEAGRPLQPTASNAAPAAAPVLTDKQIDSLVNAHRPMLGGVIPADIKDRLGVTHVGGKYFLTKEPFIIEGSRKIQELGFTTAKYFLALPDAQGRIHGYMYNSDWGLPPTATYVDVLSHPYFVRAFDCGQKRIVLNVGTPGKLRDAAAPDFGQTYSEMFAIAKYLLEKYRDRDVTFILKNWEGDWMIRGGEGVKRDAWMAVPAEKRERRARNMTGWFAARQRAVTDARAAAPGSRAKVLFAVEANLCLESKAGVTGIASDVLPNVEVDMVSWSCYEGLRDVHKLWRGIEYLRAQMRPTPYMKGERTVIIGEAGFQERVEKHNVTEMWDKFFGVIFALDVPLVIDWELYCNLPVDKEARHDDMSTGRVFRADELRGLWMIRPDGSKSETCLYWQKLLAGAGGTITAR